MNSLLSYVLKPLEPYLQRPDVQEICVVKPQQIGLELSSHGFIFEPAPDLTLEYWATLCQVLANLEGMEFDLEDQPRLSVRLPGGHRFEALLGNQVEAKVAISIRLWRPLKTTLADFGVDSKREETLIQSVKAGKTILISGGTASGKTTLLNILGHYIPLEKRILTVEDTPELRLPHENWSRYVLSRTDQNPRLGYEPLIDHIVRARPDSVLAGEVSIQNAFPLLRLLNTGHKGFMCTIHANSAEEALIAFRQTIEFTKKAPPHLEAYLRKTLDLILQVEKTPEGRRRVVEMEHRPS